MRHNDELDRRVRQYTKDAAFWVARCAVDGNREQTNERLIKALYTAYLVAVYEAQKE